MKYHRFYKSAAQVLSSLDIHVDEAVEYYGGRDVFRSLAQYRRAAWQTEEAARTDLLTELLNATDEHRFRQILDGLSDEKFRIAKIYFCGEE
jgi:hypothetical protein|nr:MAG TPA: hypothetical protein [Caudoviricetes sp.]